MLDSTINIDEIKANPVWELAFFMSEIANSNAPIGWGRYILLADSIICEYSVEKRPT